MIRNISRALLALMATSSLMGCATAIRQDAQSHNAAYNAEADRNAAVLDNLQAYRGPANVKVEKGIYLGESGVKSNTGEPLPAAASAAHLVSKTPMSIDQIARLISDQTGIRASVENLALFGTHTGSNGAAAPGATADAFDTASLTGPLAGVSSSGMTFNYTGPLAGFLDSVAAHFDVDWQFHNGVVEFLGVQTRQFTLEALPTVSTTKANIEGTLQSTNGSTGGSTGGSGGQSTSEQGTTSQTKLDYWNQVDGTLKSIVPAGTSYSVNRDAGTLTVTARPSILNQVEAYVRTENQRLERQVAIQVRVLTVSSDNNENYNFDPTIVFNDAARGLSFSYAGPAAVGAGALANAAASSVGIAATSRNTGGSFNGSSVALQALSERTNATLVTSASVTAMNNQTAPISILNQQGYLAQQTETLVQGSSTSSVSLTPGQINTGFTMSVLPRIMSNNELILNYNVTLSQLLAITNVGTATNFIQVPNVNSRSLLQSVRIRSGDTLVLAGFEGVNNSLDDRGTVSPNFFGLGGGTNTTNHRERLIILITPVILQTGSQLSAVQR